MTLHEATDVSPRARNHYQPDEYFSYNIRNGVIRNKLGTRMLTVPQELLLGIHSALDDETGAASPIILYNCGKWWGKRFSERHGLETRHFYQKDTGDLPLAFYMQVLRRAWGLFGWGRQDISLEHAEQGFIVARVENAPYSDVVGDVGHPTEALMAGMLASIISHTAGRELECVQTSCTSKGDRQTTFIVGVHARIEVIRSWVRDGRSHGQVVESIAAGELS